MVSLSTVAFADEISSVRTLGEIEEELCDYLSESYPTISYGTESYIEYLYGVLLENSDKTLSGRENYSDILLYASEYINQLNMAAIPKSEFTFFTLPQNVKNLTPNQIRVQAARTEAHQLAQYYYAKNRATAERSYFSASAAVAYARQYATSYNSGYLSYSSDCANFGSQVWRAGGVSFKTPSAGIPAGTNSTTTYWYHYFGYEPGAIAPYANLSTSFIRVADFYSYMVNNESVTVTVTSSLSTLQSTAKAGDIVQLKNSSGNYYHTIIITGGTSGSLTFCAHTTDWYERAVSNLTSASGFRIIHHN